MRLSPGSEVRSTSKAPFERKCLRQKWIVTVAHDPFCAFDDRNWKAAV
jgi:hypothetical protein